MNQGWREGHRSKGSRLYWDRRLCWRRTGVGGAGENKVSTANNEAISNRGGCLFPGADVGVVASF